MSKNAIRVLLVSFFNPFEPTSGSGLRSNSLLKNLGELGYHIDIFAFSGNEQSGSVQQVADNMRALILKKKVNSKEVTAFKSLILFRPLAIAEYLNDEVIDQFIQFTTGFEYDLVIFDNLFMYEFRRYLKQRTYICILNEHNAEYVMAFESFLNNKKLFKKTTAFLNAQLIKRYEYKALYETDCIIHVSENDLKQFDAGIAPKSIVIPNTLPYKREFIPNVSDVANVLFVGSMGHYPNVEGILNFIENVWIDIYRHRNDIHLLIVGKNPPAGLMQYDGKCNIRLLGFVENIEDMYRDAAIALTPINFGSGTRLKILEAMMNSTLNISSSKGAEGLCAVDGSQIVIANSPGEWTEKILYYLENTAERHKIEKNAYDLAMHTYYYKNYQEKLRQCIAG